MAPLACAGQFISKLVSSRVNVKASDNLRFVHTFERVDGAADVANAGCVAATEDAPGAEVAGAAGTRGAGTGGASGADAGGGALGTLEAAEMAAAVGATTIGAAATGSAVRVDVVVAAAVVAAPITPSAVGTEEVDDTELLLVGASVTSTPAFLSLRSATGLRATATGVLADADADGFSAEAPAEGRASKMVPVGSLGSVFLGGGLTNLSPASLEGVTAAVRGNPSRVTRVQPQMVGLKLRELLSELSISRRLLPTSSASFV